MRKLDTYQSIHIPVQAPEPIGSYVGKIKVENRYINNVLLCTEERSECCQMDWRARNKKLIGSEDCLYLNVYTPEVGT